MQEYEIRDAKMSGIFISFNSWKEREAREYYRANFKSAPPTDLRHGAVLVFATWETPQEADTARLDWCDKNPLPDFSQVGNDSGWNIRAAIDAARKAPEPKFDVIERPNIALCIKTHMPSTLETEK